jgi:hypothetical protein
MPVIVQGPGTNKDDIRRANKSFRT